MSGGEKELKRVEVDGNELKELVAKEDESTSLKPNEKKVLGSYWRLSIHTQRKN